MEKGKYITLSSRHITNEAWQFLEKADKHGEIFPLFTVYNKGPYGFFMYTTDKNEVNECIKDYDTYFKNVPKCLFDIYDFALKKKADIVIIDIDAEPASSLHIYSEEE